MQRRSRGALRDICEIPSENKATLNCRETWFALYASHMLLQGDGYRIRDDHERWAHFKLHVELVPQHSPPAREDYVLPCDRWKVQSGKACGPDLCPPKADVCIDIS